MPTFAPIAARTAQRLQDVQTSPLFGLIAAAQRLRSEGHPVISLSAGEPDFNTPAHIIEAAYTAMKQGQTRYTPVAGTLALREAICRKLQRENSLTYTPKQILATTGAKQALYNLCQAVLNPGDEVIIPAPYWPSYIDMVRLTGAREVVVATEAQQGFVMQAASMKRAMTPRTKLLLLNSPGNPSGGIYSANALRSIARVLDDHPNVLVASDEIYEHLNFTRDAYTSFLQVAPGLADRTVLINGLSKAFAMTGWRIGYAAGPIDLIAAMEAIQSHSTSNPSSIAQAAAIAALDGAMESVQHMHQVFSRRHNMLAQALAHIPGIQCLPASGAFYLMPQMQVLIDAAYQKGWIAQANDVAFCFWLLNQHHLALAAGTWFGAPGYLRISFAASEKQLQTCIERLRLVSEELLGD